MLSRLTLATSTQVHIVFLELTGADVIVILNTCKRTHWFRDLTCMLTSLLFSTDTTVIVNDGFEVAVHRYILNPVSALSTRM